MLDVDEDDEDDTYSFSFEFFSTCVRQSHFFAAVFLHMRRTMSVFTWESKAQLREAYTEVFEWKTLPIAQILQLP